MDIKLDFYGIGIEVISSNTRIIENIGRDFSYFKPESKNRESTRIHIEVFRESPPYHVIPKGARVTFHTKDTVNYDTGKLRFSNHLGRTLTIYDFSNEIGRIYSRDESLLHERTYLLILSRIGALLDRKGIHRVHALGISLNNKATLCLLPMRGGKTTLGLELIKEEDISLISDEIPLITGDGKILPFPLRVGVLEGAKLDIPSKYLRKFIRSQYSPKTLIDIDFFQGKISKLCNPYIVLIGQRGFSKETRLKQISKLRTILPFAVNSVLGRDLPHTVSYFLRFDLKSVLSYIKILISRFIISCKVIWRAKTYRFYMGTDPGENARFLANFLRMELREQQLRDIVQNPWRYIERGGRLKRESYMSVFSIKRDYRFKS